MTAGFSLDVDGNVLSVELRKIEDYQQVVGGWIEGVGLGLGTMYVNEEGKLKNLPLNPVATKLARASSSIFAADYIAGDVVLVGPADPEGEDTNVRDELLALAVELGAVAP